MALAWLQAVGRHSSFLQVASFLDHSIDLSARAPLGATAITCILIYVLPSPAVFFRTWTNDMGYLEWCIGVDIELKNHNP